MECDKLCATEMEDNNAKNNLEMFYDSSSDDSSSDDNNSDVSEHEFHQDKFIEMINKAHSEIYIKSTLQQNISVKRR